MQSSRFRSISIGLFVLGGMIAAGWLIVKFGEAPSAFTGGAYNVNINFKQIGITKEGTPVMLAGKRIGQVARIQFINEQNLSQGVRVIAEIEKKYKLPRTTHAVESVTSVVMGQAVIQFLVRGGVVSEPLPMDGKAIIEGEVQPLLDNILPPNMVGTMEQTVKRIGDLADAMTPVARELEQLVKSRPVKEVDQQGTQAAIANLSTVVQRFDTTLKNVNAVLGDPTNQTNFKDTLGNFHKASENVLRVIEQTDRLASELRVATEEAHGGIKDIRGLVTKADGMLDGLSGTGMDTMEAAGRAFLEAEELMRRANEGKGTLGLFASDNRLYESMLLTTERMNKALDEFRGVMEQAKRGDLKLKMF